MTDLILSKCVPEDTPELARTHREIFSRPPIYQVIYAGADPASVIDKYERGFRAGIEGQSGAGTSREATYLKVCDRRSNRIAGYIVWVYMPDGYNFDEDAQLHADDLPAGSNLELAREFKGVIASSRGLHEGRQGPHYLIALLGTHPDFERRGVASMLIRYMFDKADQDSLPCYVDSSVMAQALYRRHGFVDVNTIDVDLDRFEGGKGRGMQRWYGMMRSPIHG